VTLPTELGEFPIAKALRDRIFKIPLLPQDKIAERFTQLDQVLRPHCLDLIQAFPLVRAHYAEIVARIVSGNTQGKNFFDKEDREDGIRGDPPKVGLLKVSEQRLLREAFCLFRLQDDPESFSDVIEQSGFLRGVHEEAIEIFLLIGLPYRDLYRSRQQALQASSIRLVQIDRQLELMQEQFGIVNPEAILLWIDRTELVWRKYNTFRDELISPYFRMVYTIAKKYSTSDSQTLDNFQNGFFGLVRAVQCYTPSRFAAFSVVASSWVKQQILFHLKNEVNFIKLPIASWNLFQKLEKVKSQIENDPKTQTTEASFEQIAHLSKIPLDKVRKAYDNAKLIKVFSLNAPTQNEDNQQGTPSGARWNLESIASDSNPQHEYEAQSKTEKIFQIAAGFDPEERLIFGLMSGVLDMVEPGSIPPEDILKEQIRQQAARAGLNVNFK